MKKATTFVDYMILNIMGLG